SADPRSSRAVLKLLCFLANAGVTREDLGDGDCEGLLVPADYMGICGRWQCGNPLIDHCFFTDPVDRKSSQALAAPAADARASLPAAGPGADALASVRRRRRLRSMPARSRIRPGRLCTCGYDAWWRRAWRQHFQNASELERRRRTAAAAAAAAESTRRHGVCRWAEPFRQCDAHGGAALSQLWDRFGAQLAMKLTGEIDDEPPPAALESPPNGTREASEARPWRHCADEGEICLCAGEIRFGAGAQWAAETLNARHGLLSCIASFFEGSGALPEGTQRTCECSSPVPPGPLRVPSNATSLVSKDKKRSQAQSYIRSTPYSEDFTNGARYDYASAGAGARLVKHAKGILHARTILSPDTSTYMLASCSMRTWFVVSLLEDLFLEYIGLVSLELFASGFRHLQVLGSTKYPTDEWTVLGVVETNFTGSYELFDIGARCRQEAECWVRFLKIRVLSHHEMEDNTFCALTRFQAFGSTQMTYIADESNKPAAVDSRIEPSLADVAEWHDLTAQAALAGPLGRGAPPEAASHPPSPVRAVREESQPEPPPQPAAAAEPLGLARRGPFTQAIASIDRTLQKALQLPQVVLQSLRGPDRLEATPDEEPVGGQPASGGDEHAAAGEAAAGRPGADGSATERPRRSPLEVLAELTASDAAVLANDTGLASLQRLQLSLGSLLNSPSVAGALELAAGGGKNKSKRANKTSSSTPPLVRIDNDLREVQDGQAMLQESVKALASGLNSALVLLVDVLREHDDRAQLLEDSQKFSVCEAPGDDAGPYSYITGSAPAGPHRVLAVPRQLAESLSPDRCLLLALLAWNVLLCYRSRWQTTPAAEPTDEAVGLFCEAAQPGEDKRTILESNSLTVSGASGRRMLRELRKREQGRPRPEPLQESVCFLPGR
ncbi:unnamed protein product, partial [Prorocentrum cordatum]